MKYSKKLFFANLIWVVLFTGCAIDVNERRELPSNFEGNSMTPLVEYLNNPNNPYDLGYKYNIRKAVNYAKIPYRQSSIQNFNKTPKIAPTTRVLVLIDTQLLSDVAMQTIVTFVANGGHLFLPNVSTDLNFGYLAGIKSNAPYSFDENAQGFKFQTNFLPDLKGTIYPMKDKLDGLKRENFKEDVQVLATAANDINYPTILTYKFGRGQTIVFNTTVTAQKADRGLYFAAILAGLEQIPYPIANASAIFLDDFPAPLYDIRKEPIASEMNISMSKFVTDVWWPDMLKLSRDENIDYTAVVCFDYRNYIEPPFTTPEWEAVKKSSKGRDEIATEWLMHQIKNSGHEISLHGYNHVSLLIDDWGREDFMETSISTTYKKWKASNYGELPVTYVPPANLIDSIGLASLEMGMPSIKYIASTYLGEFAEGGDREFDAEPYNRLFFDFPRITSGFIINETSHFELQSLYIYTGIWSHFVHPDDVYQIEEAANENTRGAFDYRNSLNLGWRKSANGKTPMLPRFTNFIKKFKQTYPFIRFLKAETAAAEIQTWRYERYTHTAAEDLYTVNLSKHKGNKTTYWFAYASHENAPELGSFLNRSNLEFTKTSFLTGFLYTIKTDAASLSLPNLLQNRALTGATAEALMADVGYTAYLKADKAFATVDEEIEFLVGEKRVSEAISILQQKIEKSSETLASDLAKLATYLGYVDREFEIWPVMETAYQKTSKKNEVIALSIKLVKNSDYPNLETRKRWMTRQMELYPDDQQLIKTYLGYFSEETINLSPQALINLINTTPDRESKMHYSTVLFDLYPIDFMSFLANRKACTEDYLLPLADSIAWLFADNQQYSAAIQWSECAKSISRADVLDWYALDGNEEYLKNNDFPKYIEYLLINDTFKALNQLMEVSACDSQLVSQSTNISYAYASRGFYRKAIEWAGCSTEIPIKEILQWYYELQAYSDMEQIYNAYIASNPGDDGLKLYMAQVYAGLGNIKKSWILAASLPASSGKDELQKLLNKEVIYIDKSSQEELLKNYKDYFYPEVYSKLMKDLRLKTGNTLEISNAVLADRLTPTSIGTNITYGFYDGKENKHLVSATQYIARELELEIDSPDNITHSLYGIEYGFQSKDRFEKLNFTANARLEMDEYNAFFYRLQAGISHSKDSLYRSLTVSHKPAVTGPAYSLGIYTTNLTAYYEEQKFFTDLFAVFSLEANYYSDDALDGLLHTQIGKSFTIGTYSKLSPFTEASGMLGNKDNKKGFPYWTIKERLYGGLGLRYAFKNPSSEMEFGLEASAFADTFSEFFQRYRGSAKFPLFPYLYLTTNAEFFTLKNFYSNNFNIGLKYYFDNQ